MFTTTFVLQALLLLFVKHFIADFPLQKWAYQYANKGTYGHPGGLLHAGIHVIGTFAVFMFMFDQLSLAAVYVAGFLALLDGVIHYHVDWCHPLPRRLGENVAQQSKGLGTQYA